MSINRDINKEYKYSWCVNVGIYISLNMDICHCTAHCTQPSSYNCAGAAFPQPLHLFPFSHPLDSLLFPILWISFLFPVLWICFFFLNLWIFLFFPIFWISYFFSSSGFLSFPPSSGFLSFRNSNLSTTLSWGQGKRLQNTLGGCFWAASWATGDFKNTSPKQTHL